MNLYRRRTLQASVALLLACVIGFTVAGAQRRKPHTLRATAVLEMTTDASGVRTARLVPIIILDEGSFHDAGIYKVSPQPMALDGGVVYEVQKTGQTVGYFTVRKAAKDRIWTAMGKWQNVNAATKPSATPVPPPANIDDRPILHHRDGSNASAPATPTPAPAATPASPSQATPAPVGRSDDRPVLHHPDGGSSSAPAATSTPAPAAAQASQAAQPSEPEDPNRPTLRHRTPQSASQEDASALQGASSFKAPGTELLVAVSDAQAGDSRSFQFLWKRGEEAEMDAKVRRLAVAQLPHNNTGLPISERSLTNVVVRSFDLDLSNDAVVVLTAEVSAIAGTGAKSASASGTRKTPPAVATPPPHVTRYLTLIARVDMDGNPQRLAASVTDSSRLDVAPRLELIDAVDVDGDGYGELLFREFSFDEKSFVIYSVGRSTVSKLFEGASQPLK